MEPLVAYLHHLAIVLILGRSRRRDGGLPALARGEQVRLAAAPGHLLLLGGLAGAGDGSARLFYYAKGVASTCRTRSSSRRWRSNIAIAALSIKPTVSFLRWRRRLAESGELPPAQEIVTAAPAQSSGGGAARADALMAVLMARGIGR